MSDEFSFEVTEIDRIPFQISIEKALLALIEYLWPNLEPIKYFHPDDFKEEKKE